MNESFEAILRPFREKAAETEAATKESIARYRMGDLRLVIEDADGKPIPGASVKITQTGHEFGFGANAFLVGEFKGETNERFESLFADVFNRTTLPFYWKDLEPVEGKPRYGVDSEWIYRRPPPDLCLDFCARLGIKPKAHILSYPPHIPDWCKGDIAFEKEKLEARFASLAARYADKIQDWEVTNEVFSWHHLRTPEQLGSFYRLGEDYVEWCYRTADKYFPNNRLVMNDDRPHVFPVAEGLTYGLGPRSPYRILAENTILKGCRVDAIGMQFHMFNTPEGEAKSAKFLHNPDMLRYTFDALASLGRPLQITETTISAWGDSPEAYDFQAELLRHQYTFWFAYPAMEQIYYWNLVDGFTYGKKGDLEDGENKYRGGLLDVNVRPKPIYEMLRHLVKEVWHTDHAATTDVAGSLACHAFYGDYSCEATLPNGTKKTLAFRFAKGGDSSVHLKL